MDQIRYDLDKGGDHPYHLVSPSPWPFVGAFSGGLLALGAVMLFHPGDFGFADEGHAKWLALIAGFVAVLTIMFVWWRDVLKEAVKERLHTPVVKIGMRYGMSLFIASEVMFFSAFFWAFFNASLFPTAAIGGVWPPAAIQTIDAFHLPLLMTLVLLLSGTTVTWAHHAILEGNQKDAELGLALTVGLGIIFTCIQGYEYAHAPFHFGQLEAGIFPSTFFMATGFHGLHVLIGTIFLAVCWWRTAKGHFTPKEHFGFEAAAWYWHFVDVVWLFLFACVYWWGGG